MEGDALARFAIDITKARDGRIDPVFGREREIQQMVDVLARRRKNNPILVGEPGVGKTALVEGLALRVAAGTVPNVIRDVRILTLDLGLLQAGAGVKGEFEQRLRNVIDEVQASTVPILLFIDEAHTLIGAGNAAGGADAANLLKPALARGELRTIAATTWSEYKEFVGAMAGLCLARESGARNADAFLNQRILPAVSRELLTRMAGGTPPARIVLSSSAEGNLTIDFVDHGLPAAASSAAPVA